MRGSTIVAISTPPGRGGVGMVRLSGPRAYDIALSLCQQDKLTARQAHFVSFYSDKKEKLDQGLALFFKGPHSFTGEDVVELHGHGSPVVLDNLIRAALCLGAEIAKPGEFSERAFLK